MLRLPGQPTRRMMKQERIEQIILAYEQHVCAESLQDKVSLQDCDAETWPALVRENLPQILWQMTVHANFGALRLADMINRARHYLETDGAHISFAMLVELPEVWQAKLKGGIAGPQPSRFQTLDDPGHGRGVMLLRQDRGRCDSFDARAISAGARVTDRILILLDTIRLLWYTGHIEV